VKVLIGFPIGGLNNSFSLNSLIYLSSNNELKNYIYLTNPSLSELIMKLDVFSDTLI